MTDPTIVAATAIAAPLLDKIMGSMVSQVVTLLGQRASKALHDADKQLQAGAESRAARMAAIVRQAGQAVAPELESRQIEPAQGILDLFEMPDFLAQVSAALLFGGWPDLESLRPKFQEMFPSTPWEDLEGPLNIFYHHLQSQLRQDDVWKDILNQFQLEVKLNKLDATTLDIARLAQEIVNASKRTAEATEQTAKRLKALPYAIVDAGEQRKRKHIENLLQPYLRGLYRKCNALPLAEKKTEEGGLQPRLQRVYVEMHVQHRYTIDEIMDRLAIPHDQKPRARSRLLLSEEDQDGNRNVTGVVREVDFVARLQEYVQHKPTSRQIERIKELGIDLDRLTADLQPITALESLRNNRQLVLLGDPGSGKSTLTRRLAGAFAAVAMDEKEIEAADRNWRANLREAFDYWHLPIRIELSRWAQRLPKDAEGSAGELVKECLQVICASLGDEHKNRISEYLADELAATPPTILILLDGLDEVTDEGQRKIILAAIRDFCTSHDKVPLLVTCRIRPYQESDDFRLPLSDSTLAPLERSAIATFLERWYAEMEWAGVYDPTTALTARQRLSETLDAPNRAELLEMAGTPLLLTMMARLNYWHGLPGSRAALYDLYVQEMLWEWEKRKQRDPAAPSTLEVLLQGASVQRVSLERALARLAYQVHGQDGHRDTVDIPSWQLEREVRRIHPSDDESEKAAWALNVLKLIDDRSGLLYAIKQQEVYRFSHRTFQEFLAARWLSSGEYLGKFEERIDEEQWREATLLGLGYQIFVNGEYGQTLTVIDELLPKEPKSYLEWRRVLLLGEALRLLGVQRASEADEARLAERVLKNLPQRLTQAMQHPTLSARQRLEAGLLLSDPVTSPSQGLDLDPLGLDDFIAMPGAGFSIGRYPVTNRQFNRFVDDGGYDTSKPWWTKKAVEELQNIWGDDWRKGPRVWDDNRFNRSSQPVVGVSWYEAVAYCAWLTGKLRAEGAIDGRHEARLPTVDEWQQAAGSLRYPWGETFDAANANTKESGLEQTTPVHMYPGGKTATEIWDLAGNVWEWTYDLDKRLSREAYVLIGGAYYRDGENIGSAARSRNFPWYWFDYFGFRVVVVPISRG